MVDEALANHLSNYVTKGGHLVIGPRSGFKTLTNTVHTPAPGPLTQLMGVTITRVDGIRPGVTEFFKYGKKTLPYTTWADLITPTTAKVLARYLCHAYKDVAAVAQQSHGQGSCTTIGMWTDVESLKTILQSVLKKANVSTITLPEGVRVSKGRQYILNFNRQTVSLNGIKLEPYDVKIQPTKSGRAHLE
jgi:beta-galactosidase